MDRASASISGMASLNERAAQILEDIARLMELLGEDSFRVSAHSRAARTIADLPGDLASLCEDRTALLNIKGIGPKIADKLIEFHATGRIAEHDELAARVPPGLPVLMQIPGLGPKTVRAMWQEGGIIDLAGLERAIADGSILRLPRMGEKAVEKIRTSIAFVKTSGDRLWLGRAAAVAEEFTSALRKLPMVAEIAAAGSLRRGKDTIGDIDILVALRPAPASGSAVPADAANAAAVGEAFRTMPGVVQVLAAGESKSSVRVLLNHDSGRWKLEEQPDVKGPSIQVDLRVLPLAAWGSALMYFTGSKEHNVRMRERALKMGFTLNEWGLFPDDDREHTKAPPQTRGLHPVAARTEADVFRALGLPYLPPEIREDRGELDLTEEPRLVEVADIKCELHAHTTASDGLMPLEELVAAAKSRGFHTIVVTDHSKSSVQANGLSVERLLAQVEAIRTLRSTIKGIDILAGSEVDILADGSLDYDDRVLNELDFVVASPHTALSQDPEAATKRLLAAIRHPRVHVLGHPTGRLINRRAGLSPDFAKLTAAAKEHRVALEINAHWLRLDLRDSHVRAAVQAGCLLAIDCDVHAPGDFDNLKFGVSTARRGWLTPDQCVNTWTHRKLSEWVKSKHAPRS